MKIYDEAYKNLKNKIGRVFYLYDFHAYNSLDPISILSKFENHYRFLQRNEKEVFNLNIYEDKVLTMISLELVNGKRLHELILLELLLKKGSVDKTIYLNELDKREVFYNQDILDSVKRIFTLEFYTKGDVKKYGQKPIIHFENEQAYFNDEIQTSIKKDQSFKQLIEDAVQTGFLKSHEYEKDKQLTLYEKYTKKDVCRLLNWEKDEKGTMYGYRTK